MDKPPVATRLHGVKRDTSVAVGETHLLSIVSPYHPIYPPNMPPSDQVPKLKVNDEVQELDEEVLFNDPDSSGMRSSMHKIGSEKKTIPSLKSLCEKVAAECLVEPQNAIQLLQIADSLGADDLRKYCEEENAMVEGTITDQASEKSTFFVQRKDSSVHAEDMSTSQTTTKKKNKNGGLSMFLSGALDDAPKHILLPPPTPRSEGPAWGGAKVLKGKASLREIQDEQSKLRVNWLTGSKNQVEDLPEVRNEEGKILLSSFLPSKPIFVGPVQASQVSDVERTTPPWAASGGTHLFRPSLRDIQMQQPGKQLQTFSQSKNQSEWVSNSYWSRFAIGFPCNESPVQTRG